MKQRKISIALLALAGTFMLTLGSIQTEEAEGGFVLLGSSWPTGTAGYRTNTNFPASAGTTAAQDAALQRGASNWTTQTNANFMFNFLGNTGSTNVNPTDGSNNVFFSNQSGMGALAVTFSQSSGANFLGFDIVFFGAGILWDATAPNAAEFDIEGVATHEFGHALGLDHDVCNPASTMNAGTGPGADSVARRSLEISDRNGVEFIYGGGAPQPDPHQWAQTPQLLPPPAPDYTVRMQAVLGQPGPVEYFFERVNTNGTGGDSSGWTLSSVYVKTDLSPDSFFVYRCKARDQGTQIENTPSGTASVVTPANVPGAPTLGNATTSSFDLVSIDENGNPSRTTYAVRINGMFLDPSGTLVGSEVFRQASVWANTTVTGLSPSTQYDVDVKARNLASAETVFGPVASITTGGAGLFGPCADGNFGVANGMGGPFDVVFVNSSAGDSDHTVNVGLGSSITFEVQSPPYAGAGIFFTLWGRVGTPTAAEETVLPASIGTMCFLPCVAQPGNTNLFLFTDNLGLDGSCAPAVPSAGTPFQFTLASGIPFPLTFTLQGLGFDSGSNLNLSVTNLVRIVIS